MNILIPMAGQGRRFVEGGYSLPKPLITVNGLPMIQAAVQCLDLKGKYIFVTLKAHLSCYPSLEKLLYSLGDQLEIVIADCMTDGPARTCLLAKDFINNDEPLLIANCDQLIHWDSSDFLEFIYGTDADGVIVTYASTDPKNSFVQLDNNNQVIRVVEKQLISNIATVGLYFWRQGKYFVESAEAMITECDSYHNEYYVGPAYNHLIKQGKSKVLCYSVDHPNLVGTPNDLKNYQHNFLLDVN